ncbi:MAG: DUF2325 domain-containing protein [Ideonella sp.]
MCIPIAALRRLVDKAVAGQAVADDYELHSGAVAECRARSRLSEALQKHLDQRHQLATQRASKFKTTEALAAWWSEASAGRDLPGALWATITHPRCSHELECAVLGQVHMLQHQVGMATRVELSRFEGLIDENAVLARALADAQQRSMRQSTTWERRVLALERDLLAQRALNMVRQTELAHAQSALVELETAAPHLPERHALAQEANQLHADVHGLQRDIAAARQEARRQRARADEMQQRMQAIETRPQQLAAVPSVSVESIRPLADCAVLCVGGRPASVPLYRLVVERTGGRFLHHDGGEEESAARLDATLAAADLVICQTGCVSHGAYWRVKDHCKRTGKRCVFVETPSRAALERALADAVGTNASPRRLPYDVL